MRTTGRRRSTNIDDRRGSRGGRGLAIGGGLGTLVLVLIASFLGVDPSAILPQDGGAPVPNEQTGPIQESPQEAQQRETAEVTLASTEDTWNALFQEAGYNYREPTLTFFRDGVQSACGFAQSAVGPFYCPADQQLYLDFSFFDELGSRFGAPGDFAQAYVIAHEVGHHVQTLLGVSERVQGLRQRVSQEDANALSVRMELQADCFAGVWAYYAAQDNLLETGDVEEGLQAASAVGDDTIQRRSQGRVVPESFTHGSAAQRVSWFRRGLQSGDPDQCDTFDGQLS